MTHPTNSNSSAVLDLTTAIPAKASEHSPAGITHMLSPELSKASWLLVGSNALAVNDQAQALRMTLNRATAQGTRSRWTSTGSRRTGAWPPVLLPPARCCGGFAPWRRPPP